MFEYPKIDTDCDTEQETINRIPGWIMSHSFIRSLDNTLIATLQYAAGNKEFNDGIP